MHTIPKQKVTLEAIGQLIEKSTVNLATKDDVKDAVYVLAGAVKKGFDEVHQKFDKVDERFEKIDERFDKLEQKVETMDSRLTNQIDHLFVHYAKHSEYVFLSNRVKKIEEKIA